MRDMTRRPHPAALLARLRQQQCTEPARQALAALGRGRKHVVQADQFGLDGELPASQHRAVSHFLADILSQINIFFRAGNNDLGMEFIRQLIGQGGKVLRRPPFGPPIPPGVQAHDKIILRDGIPDQKLFHDSDIFLFDKKIGMAVGDS